MVEYPDGLEPLLDLYQFRLLCPNLSATDEQVDSVLSGVSAAIRAYCGWHVAPKTRCVFTGHGEGSLLMLPAMAFVMIAVMIGVVFIYNTCIASSLRGYMMMPCFNYVRSIIEGHLGKSLGVILLLTLISGLAAVPVVYCVSRVMVLVGNPVWTIVINTLVNTLVGVVNIYTNIGAALYFINLEMLKYRELGAIE